MFVDLKVAPPINGKFDYCVFGSGPAGITIARTLAKAGKTVGLFEAGGFEYEDESQSIYEGESVGREYDPFSCRLRYFGGTSNHWAGRCGIFDAVDFENRQDFWGLPGWPIERADLLKNLPEANSILDLGEEKFEQKDIPGWDSNNFHRSAYTHSPPTRFAEKYQAELDASKLIEIHLNANLLAFAVNRSDHRIQHAEVSNYQGRRYRLHAAHYVLCLGALENARFLLNCNLETGTLIGNQSDYLGRCFMEHLDVQIGRFVTTDESFWKNAKNPFSPSRQLLLEKKIGNGILAFNPSLKTRSYGRLRVVKEALRDIACHYDTTRNLARSYLDLRCDGDGIITALFEQIPNPDSRILLGDEKDMFNQKRLRLDWQLSPKDFHSLRIAGFEAARAMARQDKARVQLARYLFDSTKDMPITWHCHHMGTTRMSADPQFGVVDRNCKLHNSPNLYVGGSSVFPTGGGVNPTLTIVMLALRLGKYLAGKS